MNDEQWSSSAFAEADVLWPFCGMRLREIGAEQQRRGVAANSVLYSLTLIVTPVSSSSITQERFDISSPRNLE